MRNKIIFKINTVAVMLLMSFSCNNKPSETLSATRNSASRFDPSAARKVVEDGSRELMERLKNGDSTGFSNVFTTDAKVLPSGGSAVSGRDAIRSLFGSFIRAGYTNLALTTIDVWGDEDFIVEEGSYKAADSTGKEVDHGKYLKLWKQEDRKWKLFRECFNSDIPPAPSK
jgi:uncharacterized protein (TIGR02246 family)